MHGEGYDIPKGIDERMKNNRIAEREYVKEYGNSFGRSTSEEVDIFSE